MLKERRDMRMMDKIFLEITSTASVIEVSYESRETCEPNYSAVAFRRSIILNYGAAI